MLVQRTVLLLARRMPAPIYLDANATTAMDPQVAEEMLAAGKDYPGNPASQHGVGRKARRKLEECREGILALLGAKTTGMAADTLLFTSGGTEANNLAILGIQSAWQKQFPIPQRAEERTRLVVSSIEHPSIALVAEQIQAKANGLSRQLQQGLIPAEGWPEDVAFLPVDQNGVVKLENLSPLLEGRTRLVSVMLANSETGVIQPVAEIARLCAEKQVLCHTDAVQAIGKMPVSFASLGVSALTLTPHKFHGPLGIGGLVLQHGVRLEPRQIGGFQQAGLRPGTESVSLAVGFFLALEKYLKTAAETQKRLLELRDELTRLLLAKEPTAVINGVTAPRLPTTINVAFPGVDRQALLLALDMAGIACSTGTACASGSSEPSPVLLAMGLSKELVESSLRFSLSAKTTAAEIAESASKILACVDDLKARNNR